MQCPSCDSYMLNPTKIQSGLPARQCKKCGGILIDLLTYREWLESNPQEVINVDKELIEVDDNSKALLCVKCSKMMLKFRVSGSTSNKIDVCSNCDEAWLDSGEWELLGALSLQDKLNKIFSEPWQKNIRDEESEISHEQRFEELLGKNDYDKIAETKQWIDSHSKKSDLIRFLLR